MDASRILGVRVTVDSSASYEVQFAAGGFRGLGEVVERVAPGRRVVLFTDRVVHQIHGQAVRDELESGGREILPIVVPAGEVSKSLAQASKSWNKLVRGAVDRTTPLVALGGGVVGDLGGFVAATYLRGIPLIQVPTTLLAQVDSSIGGKTAVDHALGKNLIGAFYQPRAVFASMEALLTLPEREYRAGLAEVVKAGVLGDPGLFGMLESGSAAVLERRPTTLRKIVRRAVLVKARVVKRDPTESGLRAVLNLGHTLAHAIEQVDGFQGALHGEAVAIGLAAAARMSRRKGWLGADAARRICALLERLGLPTHRADLDLAAVQSAMTRDKKAVDAKVRFVAPVAIGRTEFRLIPVEALARQLVAAAA